MTANCVDQFLNLHMTFTRFVYTSHIPRLGMRLHRYHLWLFSTGESYKISSFLIHPKQPMALAPHTIHNISFLTFHHVLASEYLTPCMLSKGKHISLSCSFHADISPLPSYLPFGSNYTNQYLYVDGILDQVYSVK